MSPVVSGGCSFNSIPEQAVNIISQLDRSNMHLQRAVRARHAPAAATTGFATAVVARQAQAAAGGTAETEFPPAGRVRRDMP